MGSTLETVLDATLTLLFSPLRVLGIRKCSRCTVRTRMAQLGLLATRLLGFLPAVKRARLRWEVAAHPADFKPRLISVRGLELVSKVSQDGPSEVP